MVLISTSEIAWMEAHPGAVQYERVQGDLRRTDFQDIRLLVHLLKVVGGRSVLVRAEFAVRQTLCSAVPYATTGYMETAPYATTGYMETAVLVMRQPRTKKQEFYVSLVPPSESTHRVKDLELLGSLETY